MPKIVGRVERGQRLGRRLGFPTANVAVEEDFPLEDGVYEARVVVYGEEKPWVAVANLGRNPSVGGCQRRLEAHLIDYAGAELYGREIEVELLERLRGEKHFSSLEALKQQVERDIERVKQRRTRRTDNEKH